MGSVSDNVQFILFTQHQYSSATGLRLFCPFGELIPEALIHLFNTGYQSRI